MSKNKIFKKVTSCCLTLASVFSLSIPCHAFTGNQNAVDKLMSACEKIKENYNVTVKKYSGIQFCEFYFDNDYYQDVYCGTFYMSSDVLEKEYNEFQRLDRQSCQEFDSGGIYEFIRYLNNKINTNSESCDNYFCSHPSCSYLFIINGKIENENLYNFIKNGELMFSGLIYETEIGSEEKEYLFKKLNFEDNSQYNGYIGVLGVMSLAAVLGAGTTLFIAKKNASDSKVSKKTNSISKKVIELAKSVIN